MSTNSLKKTIPFILIFLLVCAESFGIVFLKYVAIPLPLKPIKAQKISLKVVNTNKLNLNLNTLEKKYAKISNDGFTAESILVTRLEDNLVLMDKNSNQKKYIASIAKLITAITVKSNFNLDRNIRTDSISTSVGDSNITLPNDMDYSVENLLYALLLPSSNEAAYAFANNLGDKNFIDRMNQVGKAIGLKQSVFINPAGFDDAYEENGNKITNESTAEEVTLFTKYFLHDELFRKIVSTKEKEIQSTTGEIIRMRNTNDLLGRIGGVTGVKTGTEALAGQCLVLSYERGQETFLIVILHSQDRFKEARMIIDKINAL